MTAGQYLVVADTLVETLPEQKHRPRAWGPGNNPATAVAEFLSSGQTDFEVDEVVNSKLLVTSSPRWVSPSPMTIVVTGASGFIGRRVVGCLEAAGRNVCAVDHRWKDSDDLGELLPRDVEACLHLGWYADPADYLSNAHENRASFRNGLDLAREARRRGAERLIVAGTSAEYGPSASKLVETDPTPPPRSTASARWSCLQALNSGPGIGWALDPVGTDLQRHRPG